ncbi:hypothetical protein PPERSA_07640 [Pseudocohnilembus persalinus]|uniref:Uncharacterized protein n=1 Tax=Pseudocohnilembus persalinus TaxID=266149 RepID=A0A0V0QIK9_PSEPJ|nr:hypothetical protein PPERSA_07640 [Pseudocohnilembus persalinus]|eukprot:KRX01995.1 hypothetical protein PPERSA_07640 [Pseudocohnilembus persalinus]
MSIFNNNNNNNNIQSTPGKMNKTIFSDSSLRRKKWGESTNFLQMSSQFLGNDSFEESIIFPQKKTSQYRKPIKMEIYFENDQIMTKKINDTKNQGLQFGSRKVVTHSPKAQKEYEGKSLEQIFRLNKGELVKKFEESSKISEQNLSNKNKLQGKSKKNLLEIRKQMRKERSDQFFFNQK